MFSRKQTNKVNNGNNTTVPLIMFYDSIEFDYIRFEVKSWIRKKGKCNQGQ